MSSRSLSQSFKQVSPIPGEGDGVAEACEFPDILRDPGVSCSSSSFVCVSEWSLAFESMTSWFLDHKFTQ